MNRSIRFVGLAGAVLIGASNLVNAGLITFDGQSSYNVPIAPNPYTSAEGLPAGVTAAFTGFNATAGQFTSGTHAGAGDIWIASPDLASGGTGLASIVFSTPVEVPSFWNRQVDFGGRVVISGKLAGVEQFSYVCASSEGVGSAVNNWLEVTAGAGKTIDTLSFSSGMFSAFDDMTIVPEPTSISLVGIAVSGLCLSRRRRGN